MTTPAAVRVDHVNVRVADPDALFSVLSERFALPVLWPVTAFPGFRIGGVGVGNFHIEPTRYGRGGTGRPDQAQLFSICLEPGPIDHAAAELTRRGIPHSPPVPYRGSWPAESETQLFRRVASSGPLWTWMFLGGFFGDRALARQYSSRPMKSPRLARGLGRVSASRILGGAFNTVMAPRRPYPFFCEWNAFDIHEARNRADEELRRREGGPLGVERISEIVVGASDFEGERQRWQTLLDPGQPTAEGLWPLGDGPAIRLFPDSEDRIQALTWEVTSLDRATDYLRTEHMLGQANGDTVGIATDAVQGLDIRLIESVG
jgi:hypothetical protein